MIQMTMTPRQRIRAVLHGDLPDQVPLTIYWLMLPRGERERRLRQAGLAIVERMPLYWEERPHCDLIRHEYRESGVLTVRETIRTPVGDVSSVRKLGLAYNSEMRTEFFIKRPEDYRVVEYMLRVTLYHADYEAFYVAQERLGEDGYVLPHIGYSPLMMMLVELMGLERFSLDMVEHPDEFFSLYELLCERRRELYRLYADSPAEAVLYCGNVVPHVIGRKRFEQYVIPCYNECADYRTRRANYSVCISTRTISPSPRRWPPQRSISWRRLLRHPIATCPWLKRGTSGRTRYCGATSPLPYISPAMRPSRRRPVRCFLRPARENGF